MHHPEGKELFTRLLAISDVYAEGFTATTMERWGLPFEEMLRIVRTDGNRLGDDELEESDVILPPPDLSFDEAGHEFTGEGLIPD